MENEIERVHSSLAAIAGGPGTKSGPGTSYAEAAGCYVGKHVGPRMGQSNDLINAYWKSRKSARIASITGVTEAEMWDGLQAFFHDKMRIPRTEISISDIIEVKRVKVGRGRKGNDEVLVRFLDVETRDRIASYARNLGDYVEGGRPTATFRHDIPVHLAGVHRTLMHYGYAMKGRYGLNFRKNIRFDDVSLSFCIDILIP